MLTAASLSRGLLPEPHLGEWMQEGAAVFAGTGGGDFPGVAQQVFHNLEGPGRQPHPAGVAVVDEDGGAAYLGVRRMGDAPDVIAVRQGKEGKHADEDVLQGVDAAHEVAPSGVNGVFDGIGDFSSTRPTVSKIWGGSSETNKLPISSCPGRRRFS